MQSQESHKSRVYIFAGVVFFCLIAALVYVFSAALRPIPADAVQDTPAATSTLALSPLASPLRAEPEPSLAQLVADPFVVSLHVEQGPDIGKVRVAALAQPQGANVLTSLRCERVYFAGGKGICLSREVENLAARTLAVIFDDTFRSRLPFRTDGIPSRARVSPDGRYAVLTVFVLGHSILARNATIGRSCTSFVEKGGACPKQFCFSCFDANPPNGGFFVGCILYQGDVAFFWNGLT